MIMHAEDLHEQIKAVIACEEKGDCKVRIDLPHSPFYKMQDGFYGGNGVYFNNKSCTRFSLKNKSKGVMYLALTPHTALKEFFQDEEVIARQDFEQNCMAELTATRSLTVFDVSALALQLKIPVGDLMGPKEPVYPFTQLLAQVLSPYADGMIYLSRHTGKECIVLWSDSVDGGGCLDTTSVTSLSKYSHNGKSAKQILKSELAILVA
ncbi:RES domain-containing protein [Cronobacter sakazakii]|uniref:RES family NAD+ phosphorylase n=1 Tax=Enterobacteriaceae TaxID=543 RepID=UPI0004960452|nr:MULTISPECIES: RES family NAD+ phosphorylase [Enterobacteriaceae]EGT4277847.1 RES domain-containing protein [Cronobacter sakazakii]EGT5186057.1 RES domain-containing protein [Cronobacter sakazakii]EGT5208846.1 RES domain-containing protein [Cronobacter sakazakii]EGT5667122.1 RES domain-containing protein [Cronobacter sakazakii]EGT5755497.1 RES domain-containing protein [Cronobacter sakazakii]